MTEITGGELFARTLAAEGIEFLFGLPSPEIDPLLAQLEAHGIRMVPVHHEAAGVHMAEGLYKTTGKVAAVLGNPGPGSANLLPGVVTAMHEGVPVLAITSRHRLGIAYPTPPSTFQGQDQLDLFRPAVKCGGPVFEWARIPEVLRLAFREMHNGRPVRCTSSCRHRSYMGPATRPPHRCGRRPPTGWGHRSRRRASSTRPRRFLPPPSARC
jgi:acetolactate synthase I/II/III large subunit